MSKCSVKVCNSKSRANGLCNKHHMRLRHTGTTAPGPKAHAPIEVRFWRHVKKRGVAQCWMWLGTSNANGYGLIARGAKGDHQVLAHRVAWEIANGPMPTGTWVVMHICDMPACVNPAHLKIGTQADNIRDMFSKGRANPINRPKGIEHHDARFTEAQVRAIRASSDSSKTLADRHGVNESSIQRIRSRITWKHLE